MSEELSIQSLGRVQIFIDDEPVTGLASSKVIALLIYLAQTGHIQPREALAELLWAFRTQEQALSNLRVVVSSMRKTLKPYVTITRNSLGINSNSTYTYDGAIVTRAYSLLQEVGAITSPQLQQRISTAIEQYQGPFLSGFTVDASPEFEDWVQRERERYEDMTIALYDALVTYHIENESYLAASQGAQSLLNLRPGREVSYLHLMRIAALQGERERALRYFDECRDRLDEMGFEPSSTTRELYDAIANNTFQMPVTNRTESLTGISDEALKLYIFMHATEDVPEQDLQGLQSHLPQLSHGRVTLKIVTPEHMSELITGDMPQKQALFAAIEQADLYMAIIGNGYDSDLIEAFQHATRRGLPRHIYMKSSANNNPEWAEFSQSELVRSITPHIYEDSQDLQAVIESSIQHWLYNATRSIPASTAGILLEDPDDLIYQPRRFIGRQDTLEQVHDLLDDGQRVLLQGFGGVGKTALAAQIAAERVTDTRHGLWLQAGDADFTQWAEALLRPLDDETFSADDDLDGQISAVRKALRKANIRLVVMDDVWNGTALHHLIRAIPSQTDLIVTARYQYALDVIVPVGSLNPQDALELLSYHARLAQQKGVDSAKRLCEQLGYHSFALEIAGKTLKANQWTADELLEQIQHAPQELSTPANFSANERRTVSDLIRTSYHMLDYGARAVFLAFGSLFSATATADLIQNVLQETAEHLTAALKALCNSGLLNEISDANGTYYQMHDLSFSYARANRRLAVRDVLKACADYTTAHAQDLYALEYEMNNLLGAADLAYEMAEDEVFLRIVRTLVVDGYMDARGHSSALLEQLKRAIGLVRNGDSSYQEMAHFLIGKHGNAYRERGDFENALRSYQEAVDLAAVLGMYDRQVVGLCAISSIYSNTERFAEAKLALDTAEDVINSDEVVDKYDADDIKFMRAYYLHERGLFLTFSIGDYPAARDCYVMEVALAKELEESRLHCIGLVNLGTAEYMLEEFESALEHLEEALVVANSNNNLIWRGMAYEALGETYHAMQEYPTAQTQFNEALSAYKASGVVSFLAKTMEYMQTQEQYSIPAEYLTYLNEQQSG